MPSTTAGLECFQIGQYREVFIHYRIGFEVSDYFGSWIILSSAPITFSLTIDIASSVGGISSVSMSGLWSLPSMLIRSWSWISASARVVVMIYHEVHLPLYV